MSVTKAAYLSLAAAAFRWYRNETTRRMSPTTMKPAMRYTPPSVSRSTKNTLSSAMPKRTIAKYRMGAYFLRIPSTTSTAAYSTHDADSIISRATYASAASSLTCQNDTISVDMTMTVRMLAATIDHARSWPPPLFHAAK